VRAAAAVGGRTCRVEIVASEGARAREQVASEADRSNSTWRVIIGGSHHCVVGNKLVWNSRQRNERLAVGLFVAAVFVIAALLAVVFI
jgi:hypothetical protein